MRTAALAVVVLVTSSSYALPLIVTDPNRIQADPDHPCETGSQWDATSGTCAKVVQPTRQSHQICLIGERPGQALRCSLTPTSTTTETEREMPNTRRSDRQPEMEIRRRFLDTTSPLPKTTSFSDLPSSFPADDVSKLDNTMATRRRKLGVSDLMMLPKTSLPSGVWKVPHGVGGNKGIAWATTGSYDPKKPGLGLGPGPQIFGDQKQSSRLGFRDLSPATSHTPERRSILDVIQKKKQNKKKDIFSVGIGPSTGATAWMVGGPDDAKKAQGFGLGPGPEVTSPDMQGTRLGYRDLAHEAPRQTPGPPA